MSVWYSNNNDLRVFLAYISDLKDNKGLSDYRILVDAKMSKTYIYNCKRYLKGLEMFKPKISLNLIIHISQVHNFPFDLSKYLHVLEDNQEPKI